MRSVQEIQALTTHRYLTDPEFFARVQVAYSMVSELAKYETGQDISVEASAGVILAACCALLVAELSVSSIPGDEPTWYADMQKAAMALGMTVIRQEV